MNESDFPALYQSANNSSLEGQKSFLFWTKVRLVALVLAAVCGAIDVEASGMNPAALAGVAMFVLAIFAEMYLLLEEPERTWYEGRAAAESVKTLAWKYCVGGEPFPPSAPDVDQVFLGEVKDVLKDLNALGLQPVLTAEQQITPAMRALRRADLIERKRRYAEDRILDQQQWYAKKCEWNGERRKWWGIAAVALEFLGLGGGLLRGVDAIHFDLLGIFAAVAAGATAWSQAKQYGNLRQAYFVASQELAAILSEVEEQAVEAWPAFVNDSEEAISREHTLWRSSRGVRVNLR